MCVDYRDLNKASPKDDFPLPNIDVLVGNIIGMLCFLSWMVSPVIIKFEWLLKIVRRLLSSTLMELFVIKS